MSEEKSFIDLILRTDDTNIEELASQLTEKFSKSLATSLSKGLKAAVGKFATELGSSIQLEFNDSVLKTLQSPIKLGLDTKDAQTKVDNLVKPLQEVLAKLGSTPSKSPSTPKSSTSSTTSAPATPVAVNIKGLADFAKETEAIGVPARGLQKQIEGLILGLKQLAKATDTDANGNLLYTNAQLKNLEKYELRIAQVSRALDDLKNKQFNTAQSNAQNAEIEGEKELLKIIQGKSKAESDFEIARNKAIRAGSIAEAKANQQAEELQKVRNAQSSTQGQFNFIRNTGLATTKTGLNDLEKQLESKRNEVANSKFGVPLSDVTKKTSQYENAINSARVALERLNERIKSNDITQEQANNEYQKINETLEKTRVAINQVDPDKIGRAFKSNELDKFGKALATNFAILGFTLERVGGQLQNFGQRSLQAFSQLATAAEPIEKTRNIIDQNFGEKSTRALKLNNEQQAELVRNLQDLGDLPGNNLKDTTNQFLRFADALGDTQTAFNLTKGIISLSANTGVDKSNELTQILLDAKTKDKGFNQDSFGKVQSLGGKNVQDILLKNGILNTDDANTVGPDKVIRLLANSLSKLETPALSTADKFNILSNRVAALGESVGKILGPALENASVILNEISNRAKILGDQFDKLNPSTKNFISNLALGIPVLAVVGGSLLSLLGAVAFVFTIFEKASALGAYVKSLFAATEATAALTEGTTAVAVAADTAVESITFLSKAAGFTGIGLVITAIVGAIGVLIENINGIRDQTIIVFSDLFDAFGNLYKTLGDSGILGAIKTIGGFVLSLITNVLGTILIDVLNSIVITLTTIINRISDVINAFKNGDLITVLKDTALLIYDAFASVFVNLTVLLTASLLDGFAAAIDKIASGTYFAKILRGGSNVLRGITGTDDAAVANLKKQRDINNAVDEENKKRKETNEQAVKLSDNLKRNQELTKDITKSTQGLIEAVLKVNQSLAAQQSQFQREDILAKLKFDSDRDVQQDPVGAQSRLLATGQEIKKQFRDRAFNDNIPLINEAGTQLNANAAELNQAQNELLKKANEPASLGDSPEKIAAIGKNKEGILKLIELYEKLNQLNAKAVTSLQPLGSESEEVLAQIKSIETNSQFFKSDNEIKKTSVAFDAYSKSVTNYVNAKGKQQLDIEKSQRDAEQEIASKQREAKENETALTSQRLATEQKRKEFELSKEVVKLNASADRAGAQNKFDKELSIRNKILDLQKESSENDFNARAAEGKFIRDDLFTSNLIAQNKDEEALSSDRAIKNAEIENTRLNNRLTILTKIGDQLKANADLSQESTRSLLQTLNEIQTSSDESLKFFGTNNDFFKKTQQNLIRNNTQPSEIDLENLQNQREDQARTKFETPFSSRLKDNLPKITVDVGGQLDAVSKLIDNTIEDSIASLRTKSFNSIEDLRSFADAIPSILNNVNIKIKDAQGGIISYKSVLVDSIRNSELAVESAADAYQNYQGQDEEYRNKLKETLDVRQEALNYLNQQSKQISENENATNKLLLVRETLIKNLIALRQREFLFLEAERQNATALAESELEILRNKIALDSKKGSANPEQSVENVKDANDTELEVIGRKGNSATQGLINDRDNALLKATSPEEIDKINARYDILISNNVKLTEQEKELARLNPLEALSQGLANVDQGFANTRDSITGLFDRFASGTDILNDFTKLIRDGGLGEGVNTLNQVFKDFAADGVAAFAQSLGQALVDVLVNGGNFLKSLGKFFGDILINLGKQLVALGTAAVAIGLLAKIPFLSFLDPGQLGIAQGAIAIATGAGLILAGKAIGGGGGSAEASNTNSASSANSSAGASNQAEYDPEKDKLAIYQKALKAQVLIDIKTDSGQIVKTLVKTTNRDPRLGNLIGARTTGFAL